MPTRSPGCADCAHRLQRARADCTPPRAHVRFLGPPPCARSLGHSTPLPRSTALHFSLSLRVLSGRSHHFGCCVVIWENLHPTNSFNCSISQSPSNSSLYSLFPVSPLLFQACYNQVFAPLSSGTAPVSHKLATTD